MKEKKDRIEELKKRLYSRGAKEKPKNPLLKGRGENIPRDWRREEPPRARSDSSMKKREKNTLTKLFFISLIFFIISAGIAASVIFFGSNTVSTENIRINIDGPVSVSAGETLDLKIEIENGNEVDLEAADLIVEFPEGTRAASDLSRELPRFRKSLGIVNPGEVVRETVSAVLFGEEGQTMDIGVAVEYRVSGSNAIFFSEEVFQTAIGSSPINLKASGLEEITSGRELTFEVAVSSNSNEIIENLALEANYPFGFRFQSATPKPSFGERFWVVGDLKPEEKRTFTIKGTLEGQDNEERFFDFNVGIRSERNEEEIATVFRKASHKVLVAKPFMSLAFALSGREAEEIHVKSGDSVRVDVLFENNLPDKLSNVAIELELSGNAVNKQAVQVTDGFYRSIDNTIVWSQEQNDELSFVDPGEKGKVSFTITPSVFSVSNNLENPRVIMAGSVRGRRLSESGVAEEIRESVQGAIKVSTTLDVLSEITYSSGPFQNSGPIPPKAEEETTYTITWKALNTSNDAGDVTVTASLPSYVSWLGNVSPGGERVTFNSVGGQIVWNIGELSRGSGTLGGARPVSFQVSMTPSASQIGQIPTVMTESQIIGLDFFTNERVSGTAPAVTTRLSGEGDESSARVVGGE